MKTVICTGYDPQEVLVLEEMNKPVTGDQEILVRIMLTAVNSLTGIFILLGRKYSEIDKKNHQKEF